MRATKLSYTCLCSKLLDYKLPHLNDLCLLRQMKDFAVVVWLIHLGQAYFFSTSRGLERGIQLARIA